MNYLKSTGNREHVDSNKNSTQKQNIIQEREAYF